MIFDFSIFVRPRWHKVRRKKYSKIIFDFKYCRWYTLKKVFKYIYCDRVLFSNAFIIRVRVFKKVFELNFFYSSTYFLRDRLLYTPTVFGTLCRRGDKSLTERISRRILYGFDFNNIRCAIWPQLKNRVRSYIIRFARRRCHIIMMSINCGEYHQTATYLW